MSEHAAAPGAVIRLALELLKHVSCYTKGYWPSAWEPLLADALKAERERVKAVAKEHMFSGDYCRFEAALEIAR